MTSYECFRGRCFEVKIRPHSAVFSKKKKKRSSLVWREVWWQFQLSPFFFCSSNLSWSFFSLQSVNNLWQIFRGIYKHTSSNCPKHQMTISHPLGCCFAPLVGNPCLSELQWLWIGVMMALYVNKSSLTFGCSKKKCISNLNGKKIALHFDQFFVAVSQNQIETMRRAMKIDSKIFIQIFQEAPAYYRLCQQLQ